MSEAAGSPFTDGKAADALRTIGEVAEALGIRQHVLRYWEEQFPMLRPLKRSGGRRYYRPEDVALVEAIDRLVHREGYTLKGARAVLSGKGKATQSPSVQAAPASAFAQSGESASSEQVRTVPLGLSVPRLLAIRERLSAALQG